MTVRKLNIKRVVIAALIPVFIISIIVGINYYKNLINSLEYKLEKIGYSESEIIEISNFGSTEKDYILDHKYNKMYISLFKEKYFKINKIDDYMSFYKTNNKLELKDIITKVNTHTEKDFYDEIIDADTSKNELMIVNKVYKISEDYEVPDLTLISSKYAYSGKYISESIMDNITNMMNAAKEVGYSLIISAGYRSYSEQEKIYNNIKSSSGIRYADTYAARSGHSDYQTGLAFDLEPYKAVENYEESEEYKWILKNAYKYGFILRYPKGKEEITGFEYSNTHLRYVGSEAAKYIYNNDLTFEEYYGYKFE